MDKVFILLGPPGCGKGTQTAKFAEKFKLPHIDTGSLLRKNVNESTEFGVEAKKYMDKGELVPVEIVANIIKSRLSEQDARGGYILDGFPRSVEQAHILENIQSELGYGLKNTVIYFDIPTDVLIERLVNRRYCPKCGKIYNLLTLKPEIDDVCGGCGGGLVQRADDNEETARTRFKTYDESTKPLLEYFSKQGTLKQINAQGTVEEVWKRIEEVIN